MLGILAIEEQFDHPVRRQPEQQGEAEHAQRAQADGQAAGLPRLVPAAGAIVLADTKARRVGNAHRHHEGHVHRLDGDLVCRQLRAAQCAHAQRGDEEQTGLDDVGAADRQAQAQVLADVRPAHGEQAGQQRPGPVERLPAQVQSQQQRHGRLHQRGDQTDAGQADLRQAEQAVNQHIVEDEVGRRAAETDGQHRPRLAQRAGEAAQAHEQQIAGQGEHQGLQELHGADDIGLVLPGQAQKGRRVPQQQHRQQGQRQGDPDAGLGHQPHARGVAGAMADGDQVAHRGGDADAEDRHQVVGRRAQAAGGQRLGAELAHHHGVGEYHQHVGQLRGDQRAGQAQQGEEFGAGRLWHESDSGKQIGDTVSIDRE